MIIICRRQRRWELVSVWMTTTGGAPQSDLFKFYTWSNDFKAALQIFSIFSINHLTMCNVKGFASALQSVLASVSSLFWFYRTHSHNRTHQNSFSSCRRSCFQWKSSEELTVCYLPSTKRHTGKVSDSFTGVCGDQKRRTKRRVNTGLTFARWQETQLQVNANVVARLLGEEIGC